MNLHGSTGDIKTELWSILHALKTDELDPEKAQQMISALHSLRELDTGWSCSERGASARSEESPALFFLSVITNCSLQTFVCRGMMDLYDVEVTARAEAELDKPRGGGPMT